MEMIPVTTDGKPSSNVKAIGYDAPTKMLAVEFHGGGIYHYAGVEQSHYDEMCKDSVSTGSYLHKHIKPNYKAAKQ